MPLSGGILLLALSLRCVVANVWVQPANWNGKWNSKAFLVVRNVPLKRCVEECQVRDRCKALNYWRVRRNCELIDNDVNVLVGLTERQPCLAIASTDMTQAKCENCSQVCDSADSDRTTCLVKECFAPPVVNNGYFRGNMMNVGAWRKLVCSVWYEPEADVDRVKCKDEGGWGPDVSCVPTVECGAPPQVANAKTGVIAVDTIPGIDAFYLCDQGCVVDPANSDLKLTCQPSGYWTSVGFRCLRVGNPSSFTWEIGVSKPEVGTQPRVWIRLVPVCSDPPPVLHSTISPGNTYEGSTRKYTCHNGYYIMTGSTVTTVTTIDITCQVSDSGDWTIDFKCVRGCGFTSILKNSAKPMQKIDLSSLKIITEVRPKGGGQNMGITSYTLKTSTDCTAYQTVQNPDQTDKVFNGVGLLDTPVKARCVWINPFMTSSSLRFDIRGCGL